MQKKYFLRANTSQGLVNFTDENIKRIDKIYLLCGESKFLKTQIIKNIVKYAEEKGIDAECVISPFNIAFVEGVIIRGKNAAVFDCDNSDSKRGEVINTDDFLSKSRLEKTEERRFELHKKAQEAILGLYSAYGGAKLVHDEWERIYIENIDYDRLNRFCDGLLESLINARSEGADFDVHERFFGASTPDGAVNFIDNLTKDLDTRYFIKGRPGTGKSTFLKKLLHKAKEYGYDSEVYYCSFDKNSLDMVVIPELSCCVFDSTAPHELFPERNGDKILDFYVESGLTGVDEKMGRQLSEVQRSYAFRVAEGVTKLRLFAGYEKEREGYFEEAANTELADKLSDKIARRILT